MFVLASVNLLIYLSVLVNAGDNGKIVNGIEPIAEAMVPFLDYAFELRSGFENVNKRTRILANVGLEVFANLTNYANSIIMLSDQYNDNDNSVDPHIHMYIRVIDGCAGVYKAVVSDDELGETSNVVKEKFLGSHRQMEQIQEIILQYAQRPMDYKNDLNETCIETNGMKDLLTDIHNDIVNKEGNNGTFNQLLDGGPNGELWKHWSWSISFLGMFMRLSMIRSTCFPLMYRGDNWKERFNEDINIQRNKFEQIFETILNKYNILLVNRVSNAYRALPIFLDKIWNNSTDLMTETNLYLKKNFDFSDEDSDKNFKVLIVSSSNVNYCSADLFYYSKGDNRSVVVGLGKEWLKYNCDEENETPSEIMVITKLTCFKIGESYVNYHGHNVEFIKRSN